MITKRIATGHRVAVIGPSLHRSNPVKDVFRNFVPPVFLPESDNESVPSPVKPQPRVPYCKTYEEIRLEQIQAESAAYYSYEADDYQGDVGGGKIRSITRSTRKVCLYPKIGKDKGEEKAPKGLDFEVLTLEEIRRRKRRKALQEKSTETSLKSDDHVDKQDSTDEFLKDAIQTLAELRAATASRGLKRNIEDCHEDGTPSPEKRRVRSKVSEAAAVNVPPVRLRRSPKRFSSMISATVERSRVDKLADKSLEEETGGRVADRTAVNPAERHETDNVDAKDQEDSSNTGRKTEVEVRLCDSSTDEDQTQSEGQQQAKEDRKSVGTATMADSKTATGQMSCDSLLNINEEDYLTLDMASEDILKDIDALLKDKSTV